MKKWTFLKKSGYWDPVPTNCPNSTNTLKHVTLNPQMAFTLEQDLIWCEMWNWTLWITFCVCVPMIWFILVQLPLVAPKPQNRYNSTLRWHLQLMWNVELNTLDHFLCIPPHYLGYLGPIFLTCPNTLNTLKQL